LGYGAQLKEGKEGAEGSTLASGNEDLGGGERKSTAGPGSVCDLKRQWKEVITGENIVFQRGLVWKEMFELPRPAPSRDEDPKDGTEERAW